MKTPRPASLLLFVVVGPCFFSACGSSPVEQNERTARPIDHALDPLPAPKNTPSTFAWTRDRAAFLKELHKLRDNIEKRSGAADVQLRSRLLTASERRTHLAMKTELASGKAVIDDLLFRAESATDTTWTAEKAGLSKGVTDANYWWAGLQESIDKKTSASRDENGH